MDKPEYCPKCGATMFWKEAGVRKDGVPYDGFMACPNYKTHPKTTSTSRPQGGGFKQATEGFRPPLDKAEGLIILEEITEGFRKLNERLDAMSEYFAKKDKGTLE